MNKGWGPPNHRHDGNSPLPLGMDWSPPPKNWAGRDTLWPHDPLSGWSYCVTIPAWVAIPNSRSSALDPVVFYRVLVGIQSPAGVTSTRGVLRRFNDFLKLYSDLRKAFPKKNLPSAPPKGLLRMKSKALLEERRCSLEEWISKLLSDIDISRSIAVASFLDLEAAARFSFQEASQQPSDANPTTSDQNHHNFTLPTLIGSSSVASDYGSDTVYETSEFGSPSFGRDDVSDVGLEDLTLDEDLTSPMEKIVKYSISNIDEGLLMGESILDQLEGLKAHKIQNRHITDNGSTLKSATLAVDTSGSSFESEPIKVVNHVRKPSNESIGSDLSSYKGGDMSSSWAPNLLREASVDLPPGEASGTMGSPSTSDLQYGIGDIVLPRVQQPKLDRILMIMQRRLVTTKTDMEDLISRLNQEVAVKEYLTTKVKDLEVELETTKEKSKENIQQALSLEKERIKNMEWDMEELRQKCLEYEIKLKSQQDVKSPVDSMPSPFPDKDELLRELETTKDELNKLLKQHEELEVKSKSDIKVLVKEVKSLRRSQVDLRQKLEELLLEKAEIEQLLQQEMERSEHALGARRKLLHDYQGLQSQFQETSIKFVDSNFSVDPSSILDVINLLAEFDKQIGFLVAEIRHLVPESNTVSDSNNVNTIDQELRIVLREIFLDNVKLRKQVNVLIQSALQTDTSMNENGNHYTPREAVLKQLFET